MPAAGTTTKSDQRREAVLAAAVRCFARKGLWGTTTQEIAAEAGISQPYVYRLFSDKQELFIRVIDHVSQRLVSAMADQLERSAADPDGRSGDPAAAIMTLREGYAQLVDHDRELLLMLMQANCAAGEPRIADALRHCYAVQVDFVREASNADDDQIRAMFGAGLLANVSAALDLDRIAEPWARILSGTVDPG